MDEQMGARPAPIAPRPVPKDGRRHAGLRRALADVEAFGATILGMPLRPYQAEVARAVLASIDERRGHTLTVLMPRQSGKSRVGKWPCDHSPLQEPDVRFVTASGSR